MKAPFEWWELLDFLAPDVRNDFGRLLDQLDRGMVTTTAPATTDDPAGWAGVTGRGPWERLVPSQWALADTAPEEFARRADEGELAFWDVARESQDTASSIWVWVDAGPDQLGACRVVQIALLLWLQRACFRSGGQFYWGTIQSPEKGYEKLAAEELSIFLEARSVDPPRRPPERMDTIQTWCVGAPGWMTQIPDGIQRVSVRELNSESVEIQAFGRRLILALPAARRAVRLLRDPLVWKLPAKTRTITAGSGRLAFSSNGKKVLVIGDEQITALPVPSSVNEPLGNPKVFSLPWKGEVIAVSMNRRAINLVQAQGEEWIFSRLNPPQADEKDWARVPALKGPGSGLGHCWKSQDRWHLWIGNTLYKVTDGELDVVAYTRGGSPLGGSSVLASDRGTLIDSHGDWLYSLEPSTPLRVLLARSHNFQVARIGYTLASQIKEDTWYLFRGKETREIKVSGEVLGLHSDLVQGPMLVVSNNGLLHLQGCQKQESLELDDAHSQCLVHPNGSLVYQTKSREIVCYDLHARTRLWLVNP